MGFGELLTTAPLPPTPGSSSFWIPHHLLACPGGSSQSCALSSEPGSNMGLEYRHQPSRDHGGRPGLGLRPCHLYKGPCSGKTRAGGWGNQRTMSMPENRKEERKPRGQLADLYYTYYMPDTSLCKPNILILK